MFNLADNQQASLFIAIGLRSIDSTLNAYGGQPIWRHMGPTYWPNRTPYSKSLYTLRSGQGSGLDLGRCLDFSDHAPF